MSARDGRRIFGRPNFTSIPSVVSDIIRALRSSLLILAVLLAAGIARAQGWSTIRVTAPPITPGWYPLFVIDAGQVVHIVYSPADQSEQTYLNDAGGGFARIAGFGSYQSNQDAALALDSGGVLHYVIRADGAWSGHLSYLSGKGSAFSPPAIIDTLAAPSEERNPSLAADRSGALHLVFEFSGGIYYRRRDPATGWSQRVRISGRSYRAASPVVAATPDGGVRVVYQIHGDVSSAPDTIFHVSGRGMSFADPIPVAVASANIYGGSALALDSRGRSNIVYLDDGFDLPLRSVKHIAGDSSGWSAPTVVATARAEEDHFQAASIAFDRNDRPHVAALYYDYSAGAIQKNLILHTLREHGRWAPPDTVTSAGSANFVNTHGNSFLAIRDSMIGVICFTTRWGINTDIALFTRSIDLPPRLGASPDTIDFGDVAVGRCRDSSFTVSNLEALSATPLRVLWEMASGTLGSPFRVAHDSITEIAGGDSSRIAVGFCPVETGAIERLLTLTSNGGTAILVFRGRGVPAPRISHTIALDSVTFRVGDRGLLHCTITPPLDSADHIDSLRLTLHFPSDALYPTTFITDGAALSGMGGRMMRWHADTIMIVAEESPVRGNLVGGHLFDIEFMGLFPGHWVNPVTIEGARLGGDAADTPALANGAVFLEGCRVGDTVGFARRSALRSIHPNPVVGDATITYSAPAGTTPYATVVDLLGRDRARIPLPPGTGDEQQATARLGELEPGIYLLELVDGEDRFSTFIMVPR